MPDRDPTLMFTNHELIFLLDDALQHPEVPPACLGDALRLVVHLGGNRDRSYDPEPGHKLLWHGCDLPAKTAPGDQVGFEGG